MGHAWSGWAMTYSKAMQKLRPNMGVFSWFLQSILKIKPLTSTFLVSTVKATAKKFGGNSRGNTVPDLEMSSVSENNPKLSGKEAFALGSVIPKWRHRLGSGRRPLMSGASPEQAFHETFFRNRQEASERPWKIRQEEFSEWRVEDNGTC